MKKFDIFNRFRDAVIIVNNNKEVIYKNNKFKRCFADFVDLKKFSHNANFDICPLESENVENYSPIYNSLISKEDFSARISYQNSSGKLQYYDFYATKRLKYTLMFFSDISAEAELNSVEKQNEKLKEKIKYLELQNDDLLKIKQKAQSQETGIYGYM